VRDRGVVPGSAFNELDHRGFFSRYCDTRQRWVHYNLEGSKNTAKGVPTLALRAQCEQAGTGRQPQQFQLCWVEHVALRVSGPSAATGRCLEPGRGMTQRDNLLAAMVFGGLVQERDI